MIKERAKELSDILLAYSQGKLIQISNNGNHWVEWIATNPDSIFNYNYYRIKPEPKLVPFKFSDAKFLLGKIVKGRSCIFIISNVSEHGIYNSLGNYTFKELLNNCTFEDGSPCGIIAQNE